MRFQARGVQFPRKFDVIIDFAIGDQHGSVLAMERLIARLQIDDR
jgi:hypothetical protein